MGLKAIRLVVQLLLTFTLIPGALWILILENPDKELFAACIAVLVAITGYWFKN